MKTLSRHLSLRVLALPLVVAAAGAAGCSGASDDGFVKVQAALFTNGSFESDMVGAVPSGWTLSTNQNDGIIDTRPAAQTLTSLLASGDITTMILEQLRRVVPYTTAALMLRDGNQLRITATRGFADPIRCSVISVISVARSFCTQL